MKSLLRIAFILTIVGACVVGYRAVYAIRMNALENRAYPPAPEGMVFVPPGTFAMGSDDPLADEDETQRQAFLPGFYVDTHEVTNAEFQAFDPEHTYPEGHEDYPATGITLEAARAYAKHLGKRLPTSAEWEKAARGTDGRLYPWGNTFEPGRANIVDGQGLQPVGSYPEGVSPYGAYDMTGNAWEWVETVHRDSWLAGNDRLKREVIKGGAFSYGAYQGRVSYNGFEPPGGTCNDVGFRCVKDAVPE
jgi:formylglycine-generating enzyme required for sulfatase activity